MSNIGKVALRKKAAEPEAAEGRVTVIVLRKRSGGYECSVGRVPLSAVEVDATHAPDALDMAIGWGTSRIEEMVQRGKLR